MGSRKKESCEQTLKKLKELFKEENCERFLSIKQIVKKKYKDLPVLLDFEDYGLPSVDVIMDVGDLPYILEVFNEKERFLPFEVWWGCVYPKKHLFILEFWKAWGNDTGRIFEMYLTPQDIRNLIEILRKGLEYLETDEQDEQAE
jgi:hypothetical protein